MLTIYRGNRAEWLAKVLSAQLRLSTPSISDPINIIINTWPTSRWLREQIALENGISAHINFPFPGIYLKQIVRTINGLNPNAEDPWAANKLTWTILEVLPELLDHQEATPLQNWMENKISSWSGK